MDVERARFLVSPQGAEALSLATARDLPKGLVERAAALRKLLSPAEASAVGEQLALRDRAHERLGELAPDAFLYSDAGLQMMTHPLVAARRALRFAGAGHAVVDATCGLGGDARAFAKAGLDTLGLERDRATALLAAANLRQAARVVIGDATAMPFTLSGRALFLDPSRREGSRRRFDPRAFSPSWDVCIAVARQASLAAIKTAPGIDDAAIPADAELEFVQVGRSLREATVWFGDGAEPGLRRAVLLPGGYEMTSLEAACDSATRPPARFLVDPAGCVTRAGLVRQLGAQVGGSLMDPQVAYLTSDTGTPTPFGTTLEVLEEVPFSLARLRGLLHERGWRADEIRRRAFPVEPDELRRLLKPKGSIPVTLVCTTIAGTRRVFVCKPQEVDLTAGQ